VSVSSTSVGSLAALLLGSGVVSSLLTVLGTAHIARRTESHRASRSATYSAVRVAVALEEFAAQCAENVESYSMRGNPPLFGRRAPPTVALPIPQRPSGGHG
jgi:hypothetical protein